ncbi:hypothetical protein [Bailinhaonella thermotolerans]|uniref:Uncharacterized protein n=1 Tax=Bailinhaonella thermotolerans TaxID=1070861 RepID=A0A3A4B6G3_9ACTN|nr:hypothetical protein [Bailinhaonella thermotolerans]RJL27152.1 hypothetical protein D5H75_25450 [Bailinhaonella thermotolerans]
MITDRRPPYALFWWCLLVGWTLWELLLDEIDHGALAETAFGRLAAFALGRVSPSFMCAGTYSAGPDWMWALRSGLYQAEDTLRAGTPALLAMLAFWVARSAPGRPGVHPRAAGAAFALLALPPALTRLSDPFTADLGSCGFDPELLPAADWSALLTPALPLVLVLLAAAAGVRDLPLPRLPWRPVGIAVAALLLAAGAVRLAPAARPAPATAADGTSRHALALAGPGLLVLDVERGERAGDVPVPDPYFTVYTAVARTPEPGVYYAAATDPDGWGGRGARGRSRLYRIEVDGDGGARVGGQVGGPIEGVVTGVAVSPAGRVAYWSDVMTGTDASPTTTGRLGVLGPAGHGRIAHRAAARQGHDLHRTPGLYWADARTVGLRPEGGEPRIAELDVDDPAARLRVVAPAGEAGETGALPLAGGSLVVAAGGVELPGDQELRLLDRASGRRLGRLLREDCATVSAFALDPAGRHLLAALDAESGCGPAFPLIRLDLGRVSAVAPPPSPAPEAAPDLRPPRRQIGRSPYHLSGIAW